MPLAKPPRTGATRIRSGLRGVIGRWPTSRWPRRQRGASGQGNAAFIFPCRVGKLREKFFSRLPRAEKSRGIIDLGATPGSNRRRGRETAGKPEKPRLAGWHRQ